MTHNPLTDRKRRPAPDRKAIRRKQIRAGITKTRRLLKRLAKLDAKKQPTTTTNDNHPMP